MGTPDYLAPELLGGGSIDVQHTRHTGIYDAQKVDVWASGVLLYLLTSGVYAFEDPAQPGNVVRTLSNVAAGRYRTLPPTLSPALRDLLQRMLVVDPQQRLTLDGVLAHPWLAGEGAAPVVMATDEAAAGIMARHEDSIPVAYPAAAGEPRFSFHNHQASSKELATPRISLTATVPHPALKQPGQPMAARLTPPAFTRSPAVSGGAAATPAPATQDGGKRPFGLPLRCLFWGSSSDACRE